MKTLFAFGCIACLLAPARGAEERFPFQDEGAILAVSREDPAIPLKTKLLNKEVTLPEAVKVLTTYRVVTRDQYLTYAHQVGANGSVTLKGGVTCLWQIESGYAGVVTLPAGQQVYLLRPDLKVAQGEGKALSDDERLALLKPVMTLEEVNRLWQGKALLGQACGEALDPKTGKGRGAYWNVYWLKPSAAPVVQTMKFGYFEGEDGYLFEVKGPGFRYAWKDGKYVAAEGPPKPALPVPKSAPGAAAGPAARAPLDVSGGVSENGGRLVSRKDRADGKKVLHGLQVLIGPRNEVKEYVVYNDGAMEQRHQFYPSGRPFRSQVRGPNGDGYEIVYTAELTRVVAEKVIVDGGVNIGPIKDQDVVCRGTVKADHRWEGSFLLWEPIPNGFGERLVLREFQKGEVVKSTPFPLEKLALPVDPQHKDGGSAAWPWRWAWNSPEWQDSTAWPAAR